MKGYKLNENKEHVNKIIEGIHNKNGHCPCQIKEDDTTLCPCYKLTTNGVCCCKLFVKI
jgi:ferredoxin-thioredoxin reductase catalytic subunit